MNYIIKFEIIKKSDIFDLILDFIYNSNNIETNY